MNTVDTNQATLRMVGDIESKSLAFVAMCRDESLPRDTFQGFRQFIDEVESFNLYVDVVDNRLPQLKIERQEELHKHVSQIRWKVMTLMVESSLVYLRNLRDSERPMPLGASEFLSGRLARFDDIQDHFSQFAEEHRLTPLRETAIDEAREIIEVLLGRCMKLQVFARDVDAVQQRVNDSSKLARQMAPRDPLDGRSFAVWAEALRNHEPLTLSMRSEWGRFFMTSDATETVLNACRRQKVSLDSLAQQLNVSRVSLGLMIRGADAMTREIAAKLESFVEQA